MLLEKKSKSLIENSIEMIPIYFKTRKEIEELNVEVMIISKITFAVQLNLLTIDESMQYIDYLFFYINMLEE